MVYVESAYHAQLMACYYLAREAQERRAEEYGYGYDTETADFYGTVETRVTFKQWLINSAGSSVT